ncbi:MULTISPECIES: chromate resistance protein ChrB domain-containing protein [unclassified Sinorhizobium]|uniref:chromate resistance protein ChrB domain-containing protein n=1 Tax=unclassified Sinorhizobium TaxID=2613772 RepID=UPI0035266563
MKWVTRERPVIDRIACPWLITRFIDKEPEFLFAPPDQVVRIAKETGAIPYDVPDVEFTHVGDGCSFDTFVSKYGLDRDPAIVTIAAIVRGADTDRHDLTPQSAGLLAISMGLRDLSPDDHEVLKHGFIIYDALYAWASRRKAETHSWPPAMTQASA